MDSDSSSSSSSSPPSLRRKLRTTVCGCFGSPGSGSGGGEKPRSSGNGARWRRRVAATGEFGYDPLSYALNFDDGAASDDSYGDDDAPFRYRNFNARLPRSPAPTTVAIA